MPEQYDVKVMSHYVEEHKGNYIVEKVFNVKYCKDIFKKKDKRQTLIV